MAQTFSEAELRVLRIVQKDLPDSETPYADIAREAGMTEEEVIDLLARLKESGAIRRFGVTLRHQKTAWTHNVMVAWKVSEEMADAAGGAAARHPCVSHCYFRPTTAEDWPYTLYTMVHGRSEEECLRTVEELRAIPEMGECAMLKSLKELKKTSMAYF